MIAIVAAVLAAIPAGLTVVGVVHTARPEARMAVVQAGDRTRVAAVGEMVFGLRVTAIGPDEVVLEGDDGPLRLRVTPGHAPAVLAATTVPAPATAPAGLEMERTAVLARLGAESSRILAETTLVPVMGDDGRVGGFTLTRVPADSLLTEAGLQAGDVLVEMNGVPIDSLATLVGLWPRLQNESHLRATVLRNGQPLALSVVLR